MRIHQFVHTLNYGDAISGEALLIQRILGELGIAGDIYSVNTHERLQGATKDWRSFSAPSEDEPTAVLLHYSIGSPLNAKLLETPGILRGLIYHNLTPVRWFAPYNAVVAKNLAMGSEELPKLLPEMDIVLADSAYNKSELDQMGCEHSKVLSLVLDRKKWAVAPNTGIASNLSGSGEKNILHVGRFAPNKCIEDIIKAFYFYHHKIEKKSTLWLIGSDIDTEIYSFELRRLVSELRLKHAVRFVGSVSDCELRAFYENADLYLCMSEHEGFCVPLLEAMHFGVPVVAFSATAVPETMADSGFLLKEKKAAEVAELINRILTDAKLRESAVVRGKKRAGEFSEERFAQTLREVLLEPLRERAAGGPKVSRAQQSGGVADVG